MRAGIGVGVIDELLSRQFTRKMIIVSVGVIQYIVVDAENRFFAVAVFSEHIGYQSRHIFQLVIFGKFIDNLGGVIFRLLPMFDLLRQTSHPGVDMGKQRVHHSPAGVLLGSDDTSVGVYHLIMRRQPESFFRLACRIFQHFQSRFFSQSDKRLRPRRDGSIAPNLGNPEITYRLDEMCLFKPKGGTFGRNVLKPVFVINHQVCQTD